MNRVTPAQGGDSSLRGVGEIARPSLTVSLPNFASFLSVASWRQFLDLGKMADDAGVHRIMVADHVVMGAHTDAYPWGRFSVPPEAPWLEPLTLLSAIAAVTTRVRLGTGILIAPLRPPTVLAKTVATLDVLSNGRVDLGVGVGWQREEYDASGFAFGRRGHLLTDTLAACRVLWSESPASFRSDSYNFDDIYCSPKPAQAGGPPVWLGGTLSDRNIDRILSWANGWIPPPINGATLDATVAALAPSAERLRTAWAGSGRNPSAFRILSALPLADSGAGRRELGKSMEAVPPLVASGATDVSVPIHAFCREISGAEAFFKEVVARFSDQIEMH